VSGKHHSYHATVVWEAAGGAGTTSYKAYSRDHMLGAEGKPDMLGSADAVFRGDPKRHNPEDLLVVSLSSCHLLSYLYVCAMNGVVVTHYRDEADGVMRTDADGSGHFERVTLRPHVTISSGDKEKARALHEQAHHLCFIANSVNFPVDVEPMIETAA
jgi:organic hydroperoxide reductase OsmC/OhrA